ncbi:MAG: M16 family metallopeptidase [Vulcanimicrobiota bacterium]
MKKTLLTLFCLLLGWGVAPAQTLPAGVQQVTSVEGITEYKLDNGMRVLLFPDPTSPKITVNITYLVGSRHEGYGETGMAHLLEHLMFKGSTNHTNVPEELTAHGARPNGTTWYDRTNYFETFPASDENLQWALDLESDRMVNSFIAKKDLDSEMTVVRNEFESGENSPTSILMERVFSTAFLWQNYGNATIGARSDIERVPIERLQAFYHKYYQPDNAILMVAGKIDPEQTLALVAEKFGNLPRPERKLLPTYTVEPTQDGERSVTLRRVGEVQAVATAYHIPSGAHEDFAACDILGEILGDTPSGRLYEALVKTKLATSIYGGAFQLREPGLMLFMAELRKDGSTDKVRDAMFKVVEQFKNPTPEEVERARTSLLKGLESTFRDSERISLQISEWAAMGDWRLFFLHRDRLEKVTPEQVAAAAEKYLKQSNRTLGVFIPTASPERAEIPEVADLSAVVGDYKGREGMSAGEAFDPSPDNIESRVTRYTLSSGVKVALLPKKNRGEAVNFTITFRFGNLENLQGLETPASFAGSMLMRGTTKHTRQQLADLFDQLKANGGVDGDTNSLEAAFETTRENLPEVLKLTAEVMRSPSFPQDEFDTLVRGTLADIESNLTDPQSLAATRLRRHLAPYPKGDPRYVSTLEEDIAEVKAAKLEQARTFYQNFYGASQGEIAVVGDFDPETIKPLLEQLFGDWKSPAAYARIPEEANLVGPINETIQVTDKANAIFFAANNLALQDTDPDYPALVLGNYILGGGFLNSRLATRIRQKEGLSYGVGSQVSANALDKSGRFFVYAIAAPENMAKVEVAVREELAKALSEGFTADEVAAAKKGYLESLKVSLGKDGALASTLESYLFLDRTMEWRKQWMARVEALTAEDIKAAMNRHLAVDKLSIVKAGSL